VTTDNLTEFSAEVTIIAAWIAAAAWMVYLVGAITDAYALRGGALLAWVVSVVAMSTSLRRLLRTPLPIAACGWIGSAALAISSVLGPIAAAPAWVIGTGAALIGLWVIGQSAGLDDRRLRILGVIAGGALILTIVGIASGYDSLWGVGVVVSLFAYPAWTVTLARSLDRRASMVPVAE
jgi:hypothetical protein